MKSLSTFIIAIFFCYGVFAQKSSDNKGTYFRESQESYFERVIRPWNYQFTSATFDSTIKEPQSLGRIIFWRTEPITDKKLKNWKPNISFDIYKMEDIDFCASTSKKIKSTSGCNSINIGGDVFTFGHFVFVCPSTCVDCASSNNVDYCRYIVAKILTGVNDKQTFDLRKIISELPIESRNFISAK